MFQRVVVGIDAETRGRDALALALALADRDSEVSLVHVWDEHAARDSGRDVVELEAGGTAVERERTMLQSVADAAWAPVTTEVISAPSVGAGLHRALEQADAQLLVLGSARRSRVGRVFLGDGLSQALTGVGSAVALAPAGFAARQGEITEVGVAFDGSPEGHDALAVARSLTATLPRPPAGSVSPLRPAAREQVSLSAFQAVEVPRYGLRPGTWKSIGEAASIDAAAARRSIAALGDDIVAHASCGEAVKQLAIYSDSLDLLVAGSRGYGPIGHLFHGSTTRRLARVARCPLVLVPRGWGRDWIAGRCPAHAAACAR